MKHALRWITLFLAGALVLPVFACGGGSEGPEDTGPDVVEPQCKESGVETNLGELPMPVETTVERPLFENKTFYMEIHRPSICQSAAPCVGLVLVPPGLESGEEYFEGYADELAASIPAVVFVYNPQGRGVGSNKSAGDEDYNGTANRGLLTEILKLAKKKNYVDENKLGLISFGWGLTPAAAAVSSQLGNAGYIAKFLVDVEGPVTRCDITVEPFTPTGNVINGDGEGVTPSRCNLCGGSCVEGEFPGFCGCEADGGPDCGLREIPRSCKYPAGAEDQNPPTAYVCNENVDAIRLSGHDCTDDSWWATREPQNYLSTIVVPYLRLQFRFSHRRPSHHAGREAYQWVMTGPSGILRQYNNLPPNQPVPTFAECGGSCELEFAEGNGFGFNKFVRCHPEYRPMGTSTLMRKILPLYVKYLVDAIK